MEEEITDLKELKDYIEWFVTRNNIKSLDVDIQDKEVMINIQY